MTLDEPNPCWLANRLLLLTYAVGVVSVFAFAGTRGFESLWSPETLTLSMIFALLGGLMLFKGISILKCPSKVILGSTFFVVVASLIDSTLF